MVSLFLVSVTWLMTSALDKWSLPDMHNFCPGAHICLRENETKHETLRSIMSCCRACSCADNCVNDCCFPTPTARDRTYQECMFLSTKQPPKKKQHLYRSYYVVNKVPPIGCSYAEDATNLNKALMETLSPVTSVVSGITYKNANMAKCFDDVDVIAWTPVYLCDNFGAIQSRDKMGAVTDPETFSENICRVAYTPSRDPGTPQPEECFNDLITTCSDPSFAVPSGTGLSRADIEFWCTSGLLSPYRVQGQYANVFCYLCNGKQFDRARLCETDDISRAMRRSLYGLLRTDLPLSDLLQEQPRRHVQPMACPDNQTYKTGCRTVLCPEGRVRLENGSCVVFLQAVGPYVYELGLLLQPLDPLTLHDVRSARDTDDNKEFPSKLVSPWPVEWQVHGIFNVLSVGSNESVEFLVADIYLDGKDRSFEDILLDVGRLMRHQWTVEVGNRTVSLTQEFSPFVMFITTLGTFLVPSKATFEIRTMETLYSGPGKPMSAFTLMKSFFCEQVKLGAGEYALVHYREGPTDFLYLNRTGRLHLNLEFIRYWSGRSKNTVKVCLEDSGLAKTSDGTRKNGGWITVLMLMYVIAGIRYSFP